MYTRNTVDVPPFTSIGLRHIGSLWENRGRTFIYDLISPILKKIAIAYPPSRCFEFRNYDLIAVFNNRIAIIGRCGVTHSLKWYMLATPHLTPSQYEDVVYHVSRYLDNGTCYMWNPLAGGKVFTYSMVCICYLFHYLLGSMLPLFQYIAGSM